MNNISFVVPAFNAGETLPKSIESIYNGNFQQGDEVIIVDDASTDTTKEVIEKLAQTYPGIKTLHHNYNKGSAAASRNTGIEIASNELIFALDADNMLVANSIDRLKKYMKQENADVAAFEGKFFFREDPKEITLKWHYKKKIIDLGYALSTRYWPGPSGNYLFTKQSWLKAGRYNENVGGAIDSWAFGIKQLATGSKMVVLPDSYYLHKHGYDSTYVRNEKADNLNIRGLNVITEIYNLIDPIDLEYIFSKWGRTRWLSNLEQRPIKLKPIVKRGKFTSSCYKFKYFVKDIIYS